MSAIRPVSAVVLSTGERTVERAVASLAEQTLPPACVIRVEGVTPFHRAMCEGAARVATPLFLQVDADMVLDGPCIETLAACAVDPVGMVVGLLRDPLLGVIEGVKLFRTECWREIEYSAGLDPGTEFSAGLDRHGWTTVYALANRPGPVAERNTVGEHRPDYTPSYTYGKFVVEGRRWRDRRQPEVIQDWLRRLHRSSEPVARVAALALAHGLFVEGRPQLEPHRPADDFAWLASFLASTTPPRDRFRPPLALPRLSWRSTFRHWYRLGATIAESRRPDRLLRAMDHLHRRPLPWDWLMQAALSQGAFARSFEPTRCEADWNRIAGLLHRLTLRSLLGRSAGLLHGRSAPN